jgi:hypothetical protein
LRTGQERKTYMTRILSPIIFIILLYAAQVAVCQTKIRPGSKPNNIALTPSYEYDARDFLSETQTISFNRLYPEFDSSTAVKNWKWKDVDPLGLFTPAENRKRRREQFLFEYSPDAMNPYDENPTEEQNAFRVVLQTNYSSSEILMSRKVLKLKTQYASTYDDSLPIGNLLQKISDLGLQWAQVGGSDLFVYNGAIFLASYKSGYVTLANTNIDDPPKRKSRTGK